MCFKLLEWAEKGSTQSAATGAALSLGDTDVHSGLYFLDNTHL